MKYILLVLTAVMFGCKSSNTGNLKNHSTDKSNVKTEFLTNKFDVDVPKIVKSDSLWRAELSQQEYYVLRDKGTERAFTSALNDEKRTGLYACSACGTILFNSNAKYNSGTGWPSFFRPDDENLVGESTDYDLGYARTEVHCGICDGHLGHVFEDGPQPTGLRYCINGVSLNFIPADLKGSRVGHLIEISK